MKKICAPHISTTLQAAATNIKQPLQKNEPKTRKNTTKTSLWNTVLHRIFCCCCCLVCRFLSLSNASFTAREEKRLQWQCKWKNKILCQKKQQLRFIHNHNKNEVFFASSFYIYIFACTYNTFATYICFRLCVENHDFAIHEKPCCRANKHAKSQFV